MTSGLLALQRYRPGHADAVSVGALSRIPSVGKDASTVLMSYRGFEGVPWPDVPPTIALRRGLASVEQLNEVLNYLRRRPNSDDHDLLFCASIGSLPGRVTPAGFVERGFDVGIYTGEDNCYSSILQELLFGKYPELIAFGPRLNSWLMFPSLPVAVQFRDRRAALLAQGFDLEVGDEIDVFLIATWAGLRELNDVGSSK